MDDVNDLFKDENTPAAAPQESPPESPVESQPEAQLEAPTASQPPESPSESLAESQAAPPPVEAPPRRKRRRNTQPEAPAVAVPEAPPFREAEPRLRTRLLAAISKCSEVLGVVIEKPTLDEMMPLTDEEVSILPARIARAIAAALKPDAVKVAPTIKIQLKNFELWQKQRGGNYFLWPDDAMERLHQRLVELGEGVELQPCYAHSVGCKLLDGRVLMIDRAGNIVE